MRKDFFEEEVRWDILSAKEDLGFGAGNIGVFR